MKAVMISIQPKWCKLIANGKKTIEVRKTRPKIDTPLKCYIYCTKGKENEKTCFGKYTCHIGNGKVIGYFVCDKVLEWKYLPDHTDENEYEYYIVSKDGHATCLTYDEIENYGKGKTLYAWHISDLVIYDKPREIGEFKKAGFMTEEEWLSYLYPNTHCHYEAWAQRFNIEKPPKSWCLVEELKENEK